MSEQPLKFDPYAPPLNEKETRAACEELIRFPKVVRSANDSLDGMPPSVLISFKIFNPPKPTNDPEHPLYGMVKVRGVSPDDGTARVKAAQIVREQDSAHIINVGPMGSWLPLCESKNAAQGNLKISSTRSATEDGITVAQAESKMQRELNEKYRNDESRYRRELADRVKKVEEEAAKEYDPKSLEEYVSKRNTEMTLWGQLENLSKNYNKVVEAYNKTMTYLRELDAERPEYADQWLDVYNEARVQVGLVKTVLKDDDTARYRDWTGVAKIGL